MSEAFDWPELAFSFTEDQFQPTPLIELPRLAQHIGVGSVLVKVETERPLGNFKVLGGFTVALKILAKAVGAEDLHELKAVGLSGDSMPRLICASDGNHGLAVAAAAKAARTRASIFLPAAVSETRVKRIVAAGGEVDPIAGTYDDAVRYAAGAAARGEGLLVPDTSADPEDPVVREVMAGYTLLTRELLTQLQSRAHKYPSHLFVQAGVGGLAAAMAEGLWAVMQKPKRIFTVGSATAACVAAGLAAGQPVHIPGNLETSAEMLSCGIASAPALKILQRFDTRPLVVSEGLLQTAVAALREAGGPMCTISGAAGLAGLLHIAESPSLRTSHHLSADSTVLLTPGISGNYSRISFENKTRRIGE
ncbi:pyridoxal-phosphate dependent enzyme [Microbulbifer rhizosphaerae]|uniref:Diaminopropionate ammonia-lyase n=1 Tax=Microbulbifer rhizosphaerae TaxID=1562603 RepID=A0A7W4WFA0_9GAMM|nr:pyridoxal-phosphate dependent enzyme [Microbulbifer rhizosphaerae]MBB3062541.1 diaminopropionate ammonia-lyase [Microbulbifer rhizosphaerae]